MNVSPGETRIARLENGVLSELIIERDSDVQVAGNIYLGRVTRVLPGMQAAFVDIGLEKAAFLYVADIVPDLFEGLEDDEEAEMAKEPAAANQESNQEAEIHEPAEMHDAGEDEDEMPQQAVVNGPSATVAAP